MRASFVLLGVGLAGCDLVLGLEERPTFALDVSIFTATREVRNDPAGLPVTLIVDRPRVTPTVILADDSVPEVVALADGRYSFVRATEDQAYRVSFDSDVEYQGSTRDLTIEDFVIGRADRSAPSAVDVKQTIQDSVLSTATTAYLVTTGLWTETPHTAGTGTNQSFTLNWSAAVIPDRFYDAVGVVEASKHDRAYAVSQTTATVAAGSYRRVTSACENSGWVALGTNVAVDLSCTTMPVTDACEQVHASPAEALELLATVVDPLIYTGQQHGWEIGAVPAPDHQPQFGLTLAWKQVGTAAGTAAWDAPVTFGNPVPGHAVGVRTQAGRSRQVLAPGATTGAGLGADIKSWRPAGAACGDAIPPQPVGLVASATSFAGVQLVQDGIRIGVDRNQLAVLEWSTVGTGNVDYYQVVLHEVARSFNGTFIAPRRTYVTTSTSIAVASGLLEAGKLYVFSIAVHDGYPMGSSGDFVTLGYPDSPLSISRTWSSTFTVN